MSNFSENMAVQEQTSNYISNMKLPEKVKATRLQPLGPDCIIFSSEVTDPAVFVSRHKSVNSNESVGGSKKTVQYYWCVSRDTGCVECVVKQSKPNKTVTASDPRCVITKKHRRFEAYCCMICRCNFVTILQALSHLKAMHRQNNKILIQDKDVFENIDKAMEVPPVPLPWHIAKKLVEQGKSPGEEFLAPTYVIPPGSLTSSTITSTVATESIRDNTVPNNASDLNAAMNTNNISASSKKESATDSPMTCIINALSEKFEKKVTQLKFKEDCSKLNACFADGTNVIANIPDLSYTNDTSNIPNTDNSDEPLKFFVDENSFKNGDELNISTVTLRSNRPQYAKRLFTETILAAAPESEKSPDQNNNQESTSNQSLPEIANVHSLVEDVDAGSPKPPKPAKKSVRFTVGHPDSDDERETSPESRDQETGIRSKEVPAIQVSNPLGEPVKDEEDNGLPVLSDLMSTASKGGRIIAPTSPISSTSAISSSIPKVGSSPALFSMALTDTSSGVLTRVQSWSPSVAPSPFSVASMRRPYTARGFTYAEKIQYMKQQNDYDAEFVSKHIREKETSKSKSVEETKANSDSKGRMTLRKRRKDRRHSEENHDEDEESEAEEEELDESSLTAAYTSLLQRGLYEPGSLSNIFPSEYYGSGEWANAAFETLKNLQPLLRAQEEAQQTTEMPPMRKSDMASSSSQQSFVDTKDSFSDDNVSMVKQRSVRTKAYQPRKRTKSRTESSSSAEEPGSPPKRKKHRMKAQTLNPSVHSDTRLPSGVTLHSATMGSSSLVKSESWAGQHQRTKTVAEKLPHLSKVPLSPLLSDSEKDHIQQHHFTRPIKTEPSSTLTVSKIRSLNEPPVKHLTVSNLASKNMGAKCPSDPNLSSSSSGKRNSQSQIRQSSRMSTGKGIKTTRNPSLGNQDQQAGNLLHANDQLELIDGVSMTDYAANKLITARLKSSVQDLEKQMTVLTEMPEVFRNCIESRVKIRLIQKVYSCKVCGFSVDITQGHDQGTTSPLDILEAHVMEHSLKELYATKL